MRILKHQTQFEMVMSDQVIMKHTFQEFLFKLFKSELLASSPIIWLVLLQEFIERLCEFEIRINEFSIEVPKTKERLQLP
jgi:hypothetical protein